MCTDKYLKLMVQTWVVERERKSEWEIEREREREREEDEEMQVSAHPSNLKLVLGLDRVGFGLG